MCQSIGRPNHQPPTATNHQPPPTTNRQPPSTATNRQLPTANCQSPPTTSHQPPPTMVEYMSQTRSFWENCVEECFSFSFFSSLKDRPAWFQLVPTKRCAGVGGSAPQIGYNGTRVGPGGGGGAEKNCHSTRNFTRWGGGPSVAVEKDHGKKKKASGGQESWFKRLKRCVDSVFAPDPNAGGPTVLLLLGLSMGVIVAHWLTGLG